MKTNGTFRLSKQSKIHVCHLLDAHARGEIRRSFIEAEVMQRIQPRITKQKKEEKENQNA
jgi:alpha-D-ribose 1-methylphosphonate 5-triphosphate synthase subunit PhnG